MNGEEGREEESWWEVVLDCMMCGGVCGAGGEEMKAGEREETREEIATAGGHQVGQVASELGRS